MRDGSVTRMMLTSTTPPVHVCRVRQAAALSALLVLAGIFLSSTKEGAPATATPNVRAGIYFWDPAVEIPGLPPCDPEDPTTLGPAVRNLVTQRFNKLDECHEDYQYASAWYFERALLRSHELLAPTIDSAEVVFIASSCYYEAAFWSK